MSHPLLKEILYFIIFNIVLNCNILVEVIRAADKLNLPELEKLCVFHVSNMINAGNVCKIYKEIHEKRPIVESLVSWKRYKFRKF